MRKRRLLAQILVLGAVLLLGGWVSATALQPEELVLARIAGQGHAELLAKGWPVEVYAQLTGEGGPYLLAGTTLGTVEALRAEGLEVAVLDADLGEDGYFLAYPLPGRPRPDWDAYGRLLLDDGVQVLLRIEAQDVERLVTTGASLQALTLDPKPLLLAMPGRSLTEDFPDSLVQSMIEQVEAADLLTYVGELSGETPAVIGGQVYTITTRHTASGEPIEKATQYAAEHLAALGLDVEYHTWESGSYLGRNVIGELTGETDPEEIYILCAHIDDLPAGPVAPGADDNASGSVAVLTAAEILSQYRWGCTVRFALWTGEEQGLLGSAAYAQQSSHLGEDIAGVLNLDMIAWNTPGSTPHIELHAKSSMTPTLQYAQLFADVVGAYGLDLVPQIIANGIGASDHASFWSYGYPSILGIEDYSGDFNDFYHTTNDQVEHFDVSYFTDFVKASLATFVHMSDCLLYPYQVYVPLVVHQDPLSTGGLIAR